MSGQPSLFDHVPPAPSLPYQGRTVDALVAGAAAAVSAGTRRARLVDRYLDLLLRRGAHGATDHEAAASLNCPVSSICSTRATDTAAHQITAHGHRRGPYGEINTVFVLKVAVGVRFDARGEA